MNELIIVVSPTSPRTYSENLPHGPLPPLWPKRSAYGVAGRRFGSGPCDARRILIIHQSAKGPPHEAIPLNIYVHFLSLHFCPCNWGHSKARGVCSQSEGLHFGRGHKKSSLSLRRVFGRKRKSRRFEAAGRRNSPEAVAQWKGRNGDERMK